MKLQYKILLIFFSLAVLLGTPLLWTVKHTVHQILLQDMERRGMLRVSDLAEETVPGFQARSEQQLLPHLQSAQERTGAVYAMAISSSGEVLAHTDVTQKGKNVRELESMESFPTTSPETHILKWKKAQIMDVSMPVWHTQQTNAEAFLLGESESRQKERLGTVRLGLPLDEILEIQYRLFSKIAAIVLIAGLIGLSLVIFFVRRILKPIGFLSEATSRISHGEYSQEVPIVSEDELGDLAEDFNHMRKALADTTVSKEYLSGVLDNLADPLIVASPNMFIRDVNPAALHLLGYSQNDLVGKPLDILYPEETSPLKLPENRERLQHSMLRNIEMSLHTKRGEKAPVLLSTSVFKNSAGQVEDIIITAKDMTERKRLEGLMRQSDKMSAVGQLAAGVAHEINNPLGVILGFVEAIESDLKAEDPLVDPMKAIIRETLRCKTLVQNLLTFSRERQPGMRLEDPVLVVENALSLVETQSKVKNVQMVRRFITPLPETPMDRGQIEQVVINLCTNAIDAMPQGGQLTIGLVHADIWLEIHVNDTGTGIPQEIQQRIFEPFFTTKDIGKGTGLGLSLVYDIVKKHQGNVELQSERGQGTTFIVRLPLHPASSGESLDEL